MKQKKSIIGILLIIIGIIVAIIGVVALCNLPGANSVRGDAVMRSIRSKAIFEQQVIYFLVLFIGIILFISGIVLSKMSNKTNNTMLQCKKCGTIQDISNTFCNKCGEKLK